jgi:hypothetical protein
MIGHGLRADVRPRGGFGELSARLEAMPCTIAYLGASVTAQRDGYRARLHELLCAATGQRHASVNAGTGGVGSLSGVFLMDRLVLAHAPHLCFVEYLTSDLDGRTVPAAVAPAIEGIIGKLRNHGCEPCFLHLYRSDCGFGAANEMIEAYEAVAEHHRVPSIDLAGAIHSLVAGGELRVDELLRDVVHTTRAGSELVAESILRAVLEISASSGTRRPPRRDLYADGFRRACVLAARPEWLRDQARAERKRFRFAYDYLRIGSDNCFECAFAGELVGMVVIVGPTSGIVRVSTREDVQEVMLWDEYCHYDRLSTVIFPRPCPAGRDVTIELSEAEIDYSSSRRPLERVGSSRKDLRVVGFMMRP